MIQLFNENCIDFMQSENFIETLKTKKVCIVTDPPFNVNYHYKNYKDKLKETEYYAFLKQIFTMYDIPFVVIHYPESMYKLAIEVKKSPERVVSWVYNSNTPRPHREIAFFGIKPDFRKVRQPYKNLTDKRIIERMRGGGYWWQTLRLVEH